MNRIQSYIVSIRYIISLVSFNKDKSKLIISDDHYMGLDGSPTQMKIFNPIKKKYKTTFIIYPGASPKAENHEGMILIGSILANLGYQCFIPRIPPLKELNILDRNSLWFNHAYNEITKRDDIANKEISVIGMSFGGAILIKSIAQGMFKNKKAKSIMLYGSPYDSKTFVNFLVTGEININERIKKVKQHEWGVIVTLYNFIDKINIDANKSLIKEILKNKILDNEQMIKTLSKQLTHHEKEIVDDALNGKASTRIKALCNQILNDCEEIMESISTKNYCKDIKTKTFIVHGANDTMVPYTESFLTSKHMDNNNLFISYLYEHKEISTNSGMLFKAKEFLKMIHYFSKFFYFNAN